jgi:hypothetical protein
LESNFRKTKQKYLQVEEERLEIHEVKREIKVERKRETRLEQGEEERERERFSLNR